MTFAGVSPPAVKKLSGVQLATSCVHFPVFGIDEQSVLEVSLERVVQQELSNEGMSVLTGEIIGPAFAQIALDAADELEGAMLVDANTRADLNEAESGVEQA